MSKMFESIVLQSDIFELRQLGLSEEEIEGYILFFYDFDHSTIH